METRPADFAGTWYPGSERECRSAIESFLDRGLACPDGAETILGGVVPHAGWVFSGKIACNVVKCLARPASEVETVLIFGHHMRPGSPNVIMQEGRWETPFGPLEIDSEVGRLLVGEFRFTVETASRYLQDNTIELQLPFVRYFFPGAKILPMGLPPGEEALTIAQRAAEHCARLGRKTKVLGSTDLTHYGPNYGFMPKGDSPAAVEWVKNTHDRAIIRHMLNMDARKVMQEAVDQHNACCSGAVGAAIAAATTLGAEKAEEIAYATSYDKHPDRSFVGYVGLVYYK